MSEAIHLADALEGFFTRPDNGWFTPFTIAVNQLTSSQAASIPAQGLNSIWLVVQHVAFWQEWALLRLKGLPADRKTLEGGEEGWAPIRDPESEGDWQKAVERAVRVNRELADFVRQIPDAELDIPIAPGKAARYQVLQGLIAHNAYHINEIISLRHLQGWMLEQT